MFLPPVKYRGGLLPLSLTDAGYLPSLCPVLLSSLDGRPIKQERPASPVPSCVSMKSDRSMGIPIEFREGDFSTEQRNQQERSESEILSGQSSQSHQTDLASIFSLLEENIMTFVKNE
ncbi:hypothetical protein J4Q44_G00381830, partial [Coregonus suidteri]